MFQVQAARDADVRLRSAPRIGDVEASVQNGPHDVTVTSVAIDAKALKLLKSVKLPPKGVRGHIVECEYIDGLWRIQRIRTDKKKPNSLRTAWAVLESIADRTTVQDLADALAQAWSQDDNAIAAAAHYDQRQRDRNAGKQLQDQMYRLRRLNNFVKALVLDACCVRRDAIASDSCDTASLLRDLRKPGQNRTTRATRAKALRGAGARLWERRRPGEMEESSGRHQARSVRH